MADSSFLKKLLASDKLVRAEFRNTVRPRIEKVIMRPVEIKGKRQMQISYLDGKKDTTKNFFGRQIQQKIGEILHMEFRNITIQTTQEETEIILDDRGKMKITKRKKVLYDLNLSHDRKKKYVLDPEKKYDFLVELGVQNQDGTINAEHRKKFTQINEFLKVISETIDTSSLPPIVSVLDFGCGNAYITFALHYYLAQIVKVKVKTVGIDHDEDDLKRRTQSAVNLGWDTIFFEKGEILDYKPRQEPTIVLSLHACDTATDDAIAQGIKGNAQYIFAVPCCHKYMQEHLSKDKFPAPLKQIASHNVLFQRTCDIVTDTFRALILRISEYKTDIFEFVDTTHSAKNLMIRAVKLPHGVDEKRYRKEYEELKKFWRISPYLDRFIS